MYVRIKEQIYITQSITTHWRWRVSKRFCPRGCTFYIPSITICCTNDQVAYPIMRCSASVPYTETDILTHGMTIKCDIVRCTLNKVRCTICEDMAKFNYIFAYI